MKKIFLIFTFLIGAVPAFAYQQRDYAVVRIMNKAAGKTQTITIPVGRTTEYEKLTVTVRACLQSDPFDAENHFMFAEITDASRGKIFGGWMNRNEPGQNPLQNPDYDLWLVNCQ